MSGGRRARLSSTRVCCKSKVIIEVRPYVRGEWSMIGTAAEKHERGRSTGRSSMITERQGSQGRSQRERDGVRRERDLYIYIYICCEVIIWSKFGGFLEVIIWSKLGFWKLLSGPSLCF